MLFTRIYDTINGHGAFIQRKDATEKTGVHPRMRMNVQCAFSDTRWDMNRKMGFAKCPY